MKFIDTIKYIIYYLATDTRGEFSFTPVDYSKIELPREVLDSFASAMFPKSKSFTKAISGKSILKSG